nr:MAG TPA: hypothetical protein [Caudoviricetes sp.]
MWRKTYPRLLVMGGKLLVGSLTIDVNLKR